MMMTAVIMEGATPGLGHRLPPLPPWLLLAPPQDSWVPLKSLWFHTSPSMIPGRNAGWSWQGEKPAGTAGAEVAARGAVRGAERTGAGRRQPRTKQRPAARVPSRGP